MIVPSESPDLRIRMVAYAIISEKRPGKEENAVGGPLREGGNGL
jgi:hypothetical protein